MRNEMKNRKQANSKGYKKQFTKTAKKLHTRNLVRSMRGGYRL